MPNIKSAKKRVKIIEKKTLTNNMIKTGYKSAVKKFEEAIAAGNLEEAKVLFSEATKKIDQAYEFFSFLHIPFDGDLSPSGTRRIVESVKGTYKENVVNNFLVRMQSKAKYSISTDPKSVQLLGAKNSKNGNSYVSQRLQTVNRHARNHALQELIENIKEEVVVQAGYTKFEPQTKKQQIKVFRSHILR